MAFRNTPTLTDEHNEGKVKRYVHQPLTNDHYGIHFEIKRNGRVVLQSSPMKAADGEVEYDEVEIPASLVFKLVTLLKATRNIEYVSLAEAKDLSPVDEMN